VNTLRPTIRWLILLAVLAALIVLLLVARPPSVREGAATPTAGAALVPSPRAVPPSPTPTPSPTPAPQIAIRAATSPLTITFGLQGQIPAGADEAYLWYDTLAGHQVREIPLDSARTISTSVTITPTQEGLTLTKAL